jgi:predicted component of type VI protein secretion system
VNYFAAYAIDYLQYSSVMTCQLEIVSEHRDIVGDDAVRVFDEEGGTIGRSLQNDWILPDPDRYISGRHATIDYKGGIYYLIDTSSNGVYVNGDCEPIGKGNPRRLFNGDVLRFGDFEITVSIEHGESLVVPLDEPESKVAENVSPLVPEEEIKTGVQLLDEEELTGDDDFQNALFGSPTDTGVEDRAAEVVEEKIVPPRHHVPRELAESDLVATDLIDSFLDGLGINRAELQAHVDLGELMQNAGEVMREFVEGTTALLASRANMKNAFRLDQTTVLPRHNNPLKLAANTRDSIMQLLIGKEGEYLGPRDAVREVCRDLLFHQDAFIDAMNAAFNDFADKFEPEELAETFDHNLGSNALMKWRNKSKYWGLYCELYPILTEKGSGRFPQMYAEEFVRAYERQIAESKRLGGGDLHLKETVILGEEELALPRVKEPVAGDEPVAEDALEFEDEPVVDQEPAAAADELVEEAPEPVAGDTPAKHEPDEIDLNESARLALAELDAMTDPSIEQVVEEDDFKETVAFEGISLEDLPDEEADKAS